MLKLRRGDLPGEFWQDELFYLHCRHLYFNGSERMCELRRGHLLCS